MKRILIAMAVLLTMSGVAQAQDFQPYAGISVGAFGLEYKDSAISQNKIAFGAVGKFGVDINDYFGLEMRVGGTSSGKKVYGAGVLGSTRAGTFKTSMNYFVSYLAKVQYPVTYNMRLYMMLGGTTGKFKVTNGAKAVSASKSKTGLSYGVGMDYSLNDHLSVGTEWMQYWTNVKMGNAFLPAPGKGNKVKLWGAVGSVSYHF